MLDYAVCEVSGKQYKVVPNKPLDVDFLGEGLKQVEAKVLLLSKDGKVKIGTPYLKDKITLDFIDTRKANKIRVAKFHAKANFRKVVGFRATKTRLLLTVEK
ncbi:50S ribosomal protein L21 [Candidatus Daviesbacteria bacterium]|nr:50S ribosomal protein L21 [Candidatus Daviesbacteria bacterium]